MCFRCLLLNDGSVWYFGFCFTQRNMIRRMIKPTKWHVHPGRSAWVDLGIRPIWSESSLSAWLNTGSLSTHWAYSEDWSVWADAQENKIAVLGFLNFIFVDPYIFGVKYINFTCIFGEKLLLFDRPKLFYLFISYPPAPSPSPAPPTPTYTHTHTHTHTRACTHAYTHTTNKLSKFPRKSINEKKNAGLTFLIGVTHHTKLRVKIVWPPYSKNRVVEICIWSLSQLLHWFKHQFLLKQRAGCMQYNDTRIKGEFDLI